MSEKDVVGEVKMDITIEDLGPMVPFYIPEPNRSFEIGEDIRLGNLVNVVVIGKSTDGKVYKIRYDTKPSGRSCGTYGNERVVAWYDLIPCVEPQPESLIDKDIFFINFTTRHLDSIFSTYYHFGVNDTPEYQRELCWTLEQKQALIDSIFKGIDIGKFVFINLEYKEDSPNYELLDGKQRANALLEFYEDRFEYKGKKYSELCVKDRSHFKRHLIAWAEVPERLMPNRKQLYEYFLRLNIEGVPQSEEHLNKVRKMCQEEEITLESLNKKIDELKKTIEGVCSDRGTLLIQTVLYSIGILVILMGLLD
jgi:hypothetical protein